MYISGFKSHFGFKAQFSRNGRQTVYFDRRSSHLETSKKALESLIGLYSFQISRRRPIGKGGGGRIVEIEELLEYQLLKELIVDILNKRRPPF